MAKKHSENTDNAPNTGNAENNRPGGGGERAAAVEKPVNAPDKAPAGGGTERLAEGAALAMDWIVGRFRSGEVDDWHEVEGLIRAMKNAKEVSAARLALDERSCLAQLAALEQAGSGAEALTVRFVGIDEEERT
ncbi:MAG: hypothetical protein IJP64_06330 [Oscillospiraceae bacterium]|nr:hypothetical protein [Oscillospiraceae bacterium]